MTKEEKLKRIYEVIGGLYVGTDNLNKMMYKCMIGDCLDWINNNYHKTERKTLFDTLGFLYIRPDKRKPIDDNPKAIDFVYSLLPKKDK